MLKSIIKHAAIMLALLAGQLAVVSPRTGIVGDLNLILVVLIFIAVVYKFRVALVYGFILGLALDVYSGLHFGVILFALVFMLGLVDQIAEKLLTNKSFYALIGLTAAGTIIYSVIIAGWSAAEHFWLTKDWFSVKNALNAFVHNIGWQLLLNLILMVVIFIAFHLTSRRFKAVFIDTTR